MLADDIFGEFSWFEIWGPLWFALVVAAGWLYHSSIVRSAEYTVRIGQKISVYTALVLVYLLHGSPFSIIANHYLVSALVLQLSITYFVVVPLLMTGLPTIWYRKYAWNHKLRLFIRAVGHPWRSLLIFTGLFSLYFVPGVFNLVHASIILTLFMQALLFIYAVFTWWTIVSPVPQMQTFTNMMRLAYTFTASALMMPLGFYLIIVLKAHYTGYTSTAGAIFPTLTAIYDQQLAGGIMKLIQLSSFMIAIYIIMQNWVWSEREEGYAYDKNVHVVQGIPIRKNNNKNKR